MPSIWAPEPKRIIPPGLRRPIFPGERGWDEAYRLAGLVNGGMVNGGHALVNGGLIRAHSAGGIPGLQDAVGYWKMEEATGATRVDSTGNTNLADTNSVVQAAGILGNCGQYTASSSMQLSHADNASLSVGGTDYTAIAWWQISDKSADAFVFGKGTAFTKTGMEYGLFYNQASDRISFTVYSPTDYLLRKLNDTALGSPALNTWYFTVVTESSTGNIYIETNRGSGTVSGVSAPVDGTGAFSVGAFINTKYWSGKIDTIGIWKRSLSSAELDSLYNAGAGADAY